MLQARGRHAGQRGTCRLLTVPLAARRRIDLPCGNRDGRWGGSLRAVGEQVGALVCGPSWEEEELRLQHSCLVPGEVRPQPSGLWGASWVPHPEGGEPPHLSSPGPGQMCVEHRVSWVRWPQGPLTTSEGRSGQGPPAQALSGRPGPRSCTGLAALQPWLLCGTMTPRQTQAAALGFLAAAAQATPVTGARTAVRVLLRPLATGPTGQSCSVTEVRGLPSGHISCTRLHPPLLPLAPQGST